MRTKRKTVQIIETVEDKNGSIEFRIDDDGKLDVKVDLRIQIPEGEVRFQGYLASEEVAWNIQHSLMFLAMSGQLPMQVAKGEEIAQHGPKNESLN